MDGFIFACIYCICTLDCYLHYKTVMLCLCVFVSAVVLCSQANTTWFEEQWDYWRAAIQESSHHVLDSSHVSLISVIYAKLLYDAPTSVIVHTGAVFAAV